MSSIGLALSVIAACETRVVIAWACELTNSPGSDATDRTTPVTISLHMLLPDCIEDMFDSRRLDNAY